MTNLVQNSGREFHGAAPPGSVVSHLVDADTLTFEGAALMHSASNGTVISCAPLSGGLFAGFAIEQTDNRVGSIAGGAVGDASVDVQQFGLVWLEVANAGNWARGDQDTVHASDNNTFTIAAGTDNIDIGKVVLVSEEAIGAATGRVLVRFEANAVRSL
mgnify:FL=1